VYATLELHAPMNFAGLKHLRSGQKRLLPTPRRAKYMSWTGQHRGVLTKFT
jgi:hypothetical protein